MPPWAPTALPTGPGAHLSPAPGLQGLAAPRHRRPRPVPVDPVDPAWLARPCSCLVPMDLPSSPWTWPDPTCGSASQLGLRPVCATGLPGSRGRGQPCSIPRCRGHGCWGPCPVLSLPDPSCLSLLEPAALAALRPVLCDCLCTEKWRHPSCSEF